MNSHRAKIMSNYNNDNNNNNIIVMFILVRVLMVIPVPTFSMTDKYSVYTQTHTISCAMLFIFNYMQSNKTRHAD